MEQNISNRMNVDGRGRGRPTKAEEALRGKTPPITEVVGHPPSAQVACTRCGSAFTPKIVRTAGTDRHIRCDRCGYTHTINVSLAKRLGWI